MVGTVTGGFYALSCGYSAKMTKPWDATLTQPDTVVKASPGIGEWPVGMLERDAFDFWANIKSMYYVFNVQCLVLAVQQISGYATIAFPEFASISTVGVTRRFWDFPNRSPGIHTTYREAGGVINQHSVNDLRIDFSQMMYGYNRSRKRWDWYPRCNIRAELQDSTSVSVPVGFSLTLGGSDGQLAFQGPAGQAWAGPKIPNLPITVTVTSPNGQVENATVIAQATVVERYDMIDFVPFGGGPSTPVTITMHPVDPLNTNSVVREGFKHVKEVWLGNEKLTFNPASDITGQFHETINVVTPPQGRDRTAAPFRFFASYGTQGHDDYYHTLRNFMPTVPAPPPPPPPPPASMLEFSVGAITLVEGSISVLGVTVVRTGDLGNAVSVQYSTVDGSAEARVTSLTTGLVITAGDFLGTSGTLSWAAGDGAPQAFTIPLLDDLIPEPVETFTVVLSSPTGGAIIGPTGVLTVTITDNDIPANSCQGFDYNAFANWDVVGGTMDSIGNGYHDVYPGSGYYIDTAGTTPPTDGILRSKSAFTLLPFTNYTLHYQLAGSHRSSAGATVEARIIKTADGSVLSTTTTTLPYDTGWTDVTVTINSPYAVEVRLELQNMSCGPGATDGLLLRQITFANQDTGDVLLPWVNCVPVP